MGYQVWCRTRDTRALLGWHLSRSGKSQTAESAIEQVLITRFSTQGQVPAPFLLRPESGLVFTSRNGKRPVKSHELRQKFIPHTPRRRTA